MATAQKMLFRFATKVDPKIVDESSSQLFQDDDSKVAVSNTVNNGGLIQVVTATNHGLQTGNVCHIKSVGGTVAANNSPSKRYWRVTYVDPTTIELQGSSFDSAYTTGGYVTGALVGSYDGRFTSDRLLQMYNDARDLLMLYFQMNYPKSQRASLLSGTIVRINNLQFNAGIANQPTGYLEAYRLTNSAGLFIPIVTPEEVTRLEDKESASNPFVVEHAGTFEAPSGNTYVGDASDYDLWYLGVTPFTLSDIYANTAVETIDVNFHEKLLQMAVLISQQQGGYDPMALAKSFIGKAG